MPSAASRIVGQGRILRSLRMPLRRLERYATHRARTHDEQAWAGQMADALDHALSIGLQSSAAQMSLASADRRAALGQKVTSKLIVVEGPGGGMGREEIVDPGGAQLVMIETGGPSISVEDRSGDRVGSCTQCIGRALYGLGEQ